MNFRSVADLNETVKAMCTDFRGQFDLVAGVPRSGSLAAACVGLHLNLPVTDVAGLCSNRSIEGGGRNPEDISVPSDADRVLVVDDSLNTGSQMRTVQDRIENAGLAYDVKYAAIFITSSGHEYLDYWGEVVEIPRIFEWNIMHHSRLHSSCVALETLLHDSRIDDETACKPVVKEAEPSVVPSEQIGWILSPGMEAHRSRTEEWLQEYGIEYDELVMRDGTMNSESVTDFKTETYGRTDASLFINYSKEQAVEISSRTGGPVYSYETNQMILPGKAARSKRKATVYLSRFTDDPLSFSLLAAKYVTKKFTGKLSYMHRSGNS